MDNCQVHSLSIGKKQAIDFSAADLRGKYSEDNKNRSILIVAWESKYTKTAIAIGINPSKANDSRSDKTLTTLARCLDAYGYREFKMLNPF